MWIKVKVNWFIAPIYVYSIFFVCPCIYCSTVHIVCGNSLNMFNRVLFGFCLFTDSLSGWFIVKVKSNNNIYRPQMYSFVNVDCFSIAVYSLQFARYNTIVCLIWSSIYIAVLRVFFAFLFVYSFVY